MNTYIALLRGINVGGRNRLPMKNLVSVLKGLDAVDVRTCLQSGNAVFQSTASGPATRAEKLAAAINAEHGFEPNVLILDIGALAGAMKKNPFPEAENSPQSLHLGFLSTRPDRPDLDRLERVKKTGERFRLIGSVFYLHAPNGVGRSRVAANAEKALGVPLTDRNWKTVSKIREMAREKEE